MQKLATSIFLALLSTLALVILASADNGPHGNYAAMTDKCAACHRAHTAVGDSLLAGAATANDKSQFCYTCHSGGAGAYTDVKNGLYIAAATVPISYESIALPKPVIDVPLRGGGFEAVRMNAALTGVLTLTVSSSHEVTGGSNTVWGYGPTATVPNVGATEVSLTCTNCHNPHGGAGLSNAPTYRLLKVNNVVNSPLFSNITNTATADDVRIDLGDEGLKKYWIGDSSYKNKGILYNYWDQHVSGTYAQLTIWCSQCHSRYLATFSQGPGHTDSGDGVFAFRHPVNRTDNFSCSSCHNTNPKSPGCMNCHMAHGTGARTGLYASQVPWPDASTSSNNHERSALLRLDGRGVCQQCHPK